MKNSIAMLLIFIVTAAFMPASWTLKNINSNTRGITTMKFETVGSGRVHVKIWGSCNPRDCYWGNFSTKNYLSYSEELRNTNATWITKYDPINIQLSFVKRRVTIKQHRSNHSKYKVYVKSDYNDPNRKDQLHIYYLERK